MLRHAALRVLRRGRCCHRAYNSTSTATAKPPHARIALAGAGWWAQGWHLPHLHAHPHAQVAAIVDPTLETAHWNGQTKGKHWSGSDFLDRNELGELYGCPTFEVHLACLPAACSSSHASPAAAAQTFRTELKRSRWALAFAQDMDSLLASDVELDGVLVSSNHATHAEIGIQAAQAGLHILMEKPMTTHVSEARALLHAAQASGKSFMVNNTANWRKSSQLAQELVHAGEVGEVRHVNCFMGSALGSLFEDPNAGGWVKPTGAAGMNGFGWGQLSHTLAWTYNVTDLEPDTVFSFMGEC
jgi:predicted dehydrogenase